MRVVRAETLLVSEDRRYRLEVIDYEIHATIRLGDYRLKVTLKPGEATIHLTGGRLKAVKQIIQDPALMKTLEELACATGLKIRIKMSAFLPAYTIQCRKE